MMTEIRLAGPSDFDAIWRIFHEIVAVGDSYSFDPKTSRDEAIEIWVSKPTATYVAVADGNVVGTYYIKPNQPALGSHVCNCGYMVCGHARGKGIAAAMCEHSQIEARKLGFLAMQFNLVVSTNTRAVKLWQRLGFEIVATLPKAFKHSELGLVDAHVFYKLLET